MNETSEKPNWNYRVIRHSSPTETWLGIHEVHMNGDEITGWTEEPASVTDDTAESLRWQLNKMLEALNKPILEENELLDRSERS